MFFPVTYVGLNAKFWYLVIKLKCFHQIFEALSIYNVIIVGIYLFGE